MNDGEIETQGESFSEIESKSFGESEIKRKKWMWYWRRKWKWIITVKAIMKIPMKGKEEVEEKASVKEKKCFIEIFQENV